MKKGNNCVSRVQSRSRGLVGYANCISFLIINCLLLLLIYSCYNVLLVDLIVDLCLLLGLNSKHHMCCCIALINANLLCNYKLWLIRVNMIIDNDKSPILRINLNFLARSGTFRQVLAALNICPT